MDTRARNMPEAHLARFARRAFAPIGVSVAAALASVLACASDSSSGDAPPASGPSDTATPAMSQPSRNVVATSHPVPQGRSGIALFYLAHADAQRVAQILQQLFADQAPAIVSDARTNSVIVSGNARIIEAAGQLIARLDIPLATRPVVVVAGGAATRPVRQAATEPTTEPGGHLGPAGLPQLLRRGDGAALRPGQETGRGCERGVPSFGQDGSEEGRFRQQDRHGR